MKGGCLERFQMGRISGLAFRVSEFLWYSGLSEAVVSGRFINYLVCLVVRGWLLLGARGSDRLYGVAGAIRQLSEGKVTHGQETRHASQRVGSISSRR